MAWSLISPASKGIGFALTRHILQNTQLPVIATARKDIAETKERILMDLKQVDPERLTLLQLDVTARPSTSINPYSSLVRALDESSIINAAATANARFPSPEHHLHAAISLPGVLYPEKSPAQMQHAQLLHTFATNVIGPSLLFKHFSPFLPGKRAALPPLDPSWPRQAVWLNMSARVGSISDNKLGGWYSYRASKAALNSATKSFDLFLQNRCADKAIAIAYHPGTVKTDLSKDFWSGVPAEKLFSPEFAAEKLWEVVRNVEPSGRGKCFDWKNEVILP